MGISQYIFLIVSILTIYWAAKQYGAIRRNILLGKPEKIEGDDGQRYKNVLLIAFGQKKMFQKFIPAILHLFIYTAFLLTQIELLEIFIDGVTGSHRIFAPYLGGFYTFIIGFIEVLSALAFVATIIFLWRRNILKVPRFHMSEMSGWPKFDGNMILVGEILLLIGIFSMNGADTVLQVKDSLHYHSTGTLPISGWLGPLLFENLGKDLLILIERSGWWLHLLVVLWFINYLPKSKHLHIILAFFNVYYSRIKPRGEMANIDSITNEVKSMMGIPVEVEVNNEGGEILDFGANDIFGLSWKNLLDAYTCTECGRCTTVCPANLTGKKLSPRKIMMDIRDRAEEVGQKIDSGQQSAGDYNDGKSLFDYISREEIHACTTCNACVEACPVMINPLEPILELRRYEILTESKGPSDWLPMFNSVENSGSVWPISEDRDNWTKLLNN